jgi:WD40 repeat protein
LQPAAGGEIFVRSGYKQLTAIAPDGSTRGLSLQNMQESVVGLKASPDGAWLAGPTAYIYRAPYSLYNTRTAAERLFEDQEGDIYGLAFSPDSKTLVFGVSNTTPDVWKLSLLDLESGDVTVLLRGSDTPMFVPIGWTSQGIIASQHWYAGADGVPAGLFLIDAQDGSVKTWRDPLEPFAYGLPSRDGEQVAVVAGDFGLGVEQPTAWLGILETALGELRLVEPESFEGLKLLGWSPDGSKLLYARVPVDNPLAASYRLLEQGSIEPAQLDLSFVPGEIKDIVWRDSETLLLLAHEGAQDRLYELPISAGGAGDLKELATIELEPADPMYDSEILFAGR